MTDVSAVNSVFSDLSIRNKKDDDGASQELGQSAFLQLMITQLENQDPLSPQDNGEFIAQLAQFSSVESLDKLNNNFESFARSQAANQALQASTLVGSSVSVATDTGLLRAGDVVTTSATIPASTGNVQLTIYADNGTLLETIPLGPQPAGELIARWDGANIELNGQMLDWRTSHDGGLPAGQYRFEMTADIDGEPTAMSTAISANVNSVTVGENGQLTLNLAGIGAVSIEDVKQFNE